MNLYLLKRCIEELHNALRLAIWANIVADETCYELLGVRGHLGILGILGILGRMFAGLRATTI